MAKTALQVYIEYLSRGQGNAAAGMAAIDTGLRNLGKSADSLNEKLNRVDQTLAGWQRTASLIAGAGIGGMSLLLREGVKVHGMFERINLSLEVMLGNKERADALMQDVVKFAATTPFSLMDLSKAVNQMKAFRVETENVLPYLRIIGEAAATMDVPIAQAIRAMLQLRGGLFETQQLVPIGINRNLLKEYGVEFETSGQLKSTGEKAFQAALKAMEDQFGGLFGRVNQTVDGMLNNLGDNVTRFFDDLGKGLEAKTKEILSRINSKLTEVLDTPALRDSVRRAVAEVVAELEPYIDQALDWLDRLIEHLRQNPRALVDGMHAFLDILKAVTAAVLALTAARGIIALISGLTTIAGILGGGGLGGAIAVVAGGAGLIGLFRMFKDMLDGTSGSLPGLTSGLNSAATEGSALAGSFGEIQTIGSQLPGVIGEITEQIAGLNREIRDAGETTFPGFLHSIIGGFGEYGPDYLSGLLTTIRGITAYNSGQRLRLDDGREVTWSELNEIFLSGENPTVNGQPVTTWGDSERGLEDFTGWGNTDWSSSSYYNALGMQLEARDREEAGWQRLRDQRSMAEYPELEAKTRQFLRGLPAAPELNGKKVCVFKSRDAFWVMAEDDPAAKPIFDAFTGSVQTTIPGLTDLGLERTTDPLPGDFVFLDRRDGTNQYADGHAGLFWGTNPEGQYMITGNGAGSLYAVPSEFGAIHGDPYTNQRGLVAFANPFSWVRRAGGYSLPESEAAAAPEGFPDLGLGTAAEAVAKLMEERQKAAERLVKATEEQVAKQEAMLDLATESEREQIKKKIEDTKATAYVTAYTEGLQRLIDSGTMAGWMESFSRVRAANIALAEDLERQTQVEKDLEGLDTASAERIRSLRAGGAGEGQITAATIDALIERKNRLGLAIANEDDPAVIAQYQTQVGVITDQLLDIHDRLAAIGDRATPTAQHLADLALAAANAAIALPGLVEALKQAAGSAAGGIQSLALTLPGGPATEPDGTADPYWSGNQASGGNGDRQMVFDPTTNRYVWVDYNCGPDG